VVEDKVENSKRAIEACEKALEVRTRERYPIDYGMTQNNLGNAYSTLAEVEGKAENSKRAIEACEEALKVYTRDRFPMDYARTQIILGNAYNTLAEVEDKADLAEVEDKAENSKRAIEAYEEALKVFTESEYPEIFPLVERNLKILRDFCSGD
jgi:tetratricopeptide (TPR) repeat protein